VAYPLNALRAFEASARHRSFVKAANELHVTPAAISHQVKKLEEHPGLMAEMLFNESVTPMCSPRLLEGKRALTRPDDLRHHVLLHDDSMAFDPEAPIWETWLKAVGAHRVDASRGPRFSQPDHALQAAIDGAGVVLGWRYLAAADITAGRLAMPFELLLPLGSSFYLVHPQSHADRRKIRAFRSWVLEEIRSDQTLTSDARTSV
jgi:LysR family glycine cleavage system transcriptional activator